MLRKFAEGLVFGAGFALAFIILWYSAAYWVAPKFVTTQIDNAIEKAEHEGLAERPSEIRAHSPIEDEPEFHELSIDQQIRKASVIAVAQFERSPEGAPKAMFKESLKRDPNVEFYYKLGDEYPDGGRGISKDVDYGEGLIVFFVGSPASMRLSISYSGERIRGLGDIPLKLIRQKCKSPDA